MISKSVCALPETNLFNALLVALQHPLAEVPMSYFDVVTDSTTGVSHTVIVIATNLYRRCSINDGPVSVHSLMQCGCGSSIVAESLMNHVLRFQSTRGLPRLNETWTPDMSLNDGQLQTPLISVGQTSTSVKNDLLTKHIGFDTWLLRMCYIPHSAFIALQTAFMASGSTYERTTSIPRHLLPPAGLHTVNPSIILEADTQHTSDDEPTTRCKCLWRWWRF